MTQQSQHSGAATDEFDAAKIIVATLKALDAQQQARAMRFASETLGLHAPPPGSVATSQSSLSASPSLTTALAAPMDIKRFSEAKAPKTDQQFAAVVAYFYRFEAPDAERSDEIDAKTLENAFRLADRKRPGDYVATLNNAKNSGYLDATGRGKFRINSVGENLVAMTLPGSNGDTPKKKGGRKKTKTSSKNTRTRKPRRKSK